jgi:hypothetical protein
MSGPAQQHVNTVVESARWTVVFWLLVRPSGNTELLRIHPCVASSP